MAGPEKIRRAVHREVEESEPKCGPSDRGIYTPDIDRRIQEGICERTSTERARPPLQPGSSFFPEVTIRTDATNLLQLRCRCRRLAVARLHGPEPRQDPKRPLPGLLSGISQGRRRPNGSWMYGPFGLAVIKR